MRADANSKKGVCRKTTATVIAVLTVNLICISSVTAQRNELSAADARMEIAKLGTGPQAVVRVILKNKKKVQGWLSFADDGHFTVTAEKSGAVTSIKYSDVSSVKNLKPSRGALVAGIAGGLSLAVVIFLFAGAKH